MSTHLVQLWSGSDGRVEGVVAVQRELRVARTGRSGPRTTRGRRDERWPLAERPVRLRGSGQGWRPGHRRHASRWSAWGLHRRLQPSHRALSAPRHGSQPAQRIGVPEPKHKHQDVTPSWNVSHKGISITRFFARESPRGVTYPRRLSSAAYLCSGGCHTLCICCFHDIISFFCFCVKACNKG